MEFKLLIALVSATILTACGGGGSGDTPGSGTTQTTPEPKELVYKFKDAPFEPELYNLGAPSGEESVFDPGDIIHLTWKVDIYYSDNSSTGFGESYLYDTSVYLSDDNQLQEASDLKLFDIECSFPTTSEHACGNDAYFQCKYAEGNANEVKCTSIPLDKTKGIKNLAVDTTVWLTAIPKDAFLIAKACLRDIPDMCIQTELPLQLR